MLLENINTANHFVSTRWKCCYPYGWDNILKAASAVFDYYDNIEILVNNKPLNISAKADIANIGENRSMCIRGNSKLLKMPLMISFYNQMNFIDVHVPQFVKGFEKADYESVNRELATYLTSIELAMFR